jgi:hypothetical protein
MVMEPNAVSLMGIVPPPAVAGIAAISIAGPRSAGDGFPGKNPDSGV